MSHLDYAAAAFGFEPPVPEPPTPADLPCPGPGEVLCVIGPSGAGKTLALRALMTRGARELTPLHPAQLDLPALQLFGPRVDSRQVLRTLARVGLADGRLWGMSAGSLSAGERRRLELALALCGARPGTLLVADEFDAHLDSTTARVLAQNLRRIAVRQRLRIAASTHRPETLPQLAPWRLFEIRRGRAHELAPPPALDLGDRLTVAPGRVLDYEPFAQWHYLGPGRPGPSALVLVARFNARPVGIAMFGYPHLMLRARAEVLPQFAPVRIRADGAAGLNADVRLLQRVVVDPRFRGIGVSRRLIRQGLAMLGVPYVECIAQMGAFSDFLLAAGFRHVCDVDPPPAARKLLNFANELGFSPAALVEPARREALMKYLAPPDAERLQTLLRRLVQSRIETGHGSRRGKPGGDFEPVLRKALSRIAARPAYFLWTSENTP